MIYLSIDTETTGLDPQQCQVLEFGAILENTENPLPFEESDKFHAYIKHDIYTGNAYALQMNAHILKILADDKLDNIYTPDEFVEKFINWLLDMDEKYNCFKVNKRDNRIGGINVAGKNFASFDKNFLMNLSPAFGKVIFFVHRAIDPATLYLDWEIDKTAPSLDVCLERAGIEKKVTHNALEDAWDVIQVLRVKYLGWNKDDTRTN